MRHVALTAAVFILAACQQGAPVPAPTAKPPAPQPATAPAPAATPPPAPAPSFQPPTPTELFHLRSECTELTDKLAATLPKVDEGLERHVVSHYIANENRCYVRSIVLTEVSQRDNGKPFVLRQHLWDGQTRDVLAWTERKGDAKTSYLSKDRLHDDYDATDKYINEKMKDDH